MKKMFLAAALVCASPWCHAEELTAAKAEELLQPQMPGECGSYYTSQGEPEFAALEGKVICQYRPKVTHLSLDSSGTAAAVNYTRDRAFDSALSTAWLDAYAKMEPRNPNSLLFRKLKSNLESYRANGGFDHGYKPSKASLKFVEGEWKVMSIN